MNKQSEILVAKEAIQAQVKQAEKIFNTASRHENYAEMATSQSYLSGLIMALNIVEICSKGLAP